MELEYIALKYREINTWMHNNLPKGVDKLLHFLCGCLIAASIMYFAPHTEFWKVFAIILPIAI